MRANDGDAPGGRWTQGQRTVVAQQDDRLCRSSAQQCDVGGRRLAGTEDWLGSVERADPLEATEEAAQRVVEIGLVYVPLLNGSRQRGTECSRGPRHLEVEPGAESDGRLDDAEPVGHDQAFETPLVTQDVDEEPALLGQPAPVQAVVPRHDAECPALAHGELERDQVQLAQRAFVDDRAHGGALELGVVAHEMLHGGEDAIGLDAAHVARRENAGEQRVLGVALEVAATQGRAVQVHGGSKESAAPPVKGLPAHECTERLGRLGVPGRSNGRAARDADRRGALDTREGISAGAVGAVRDADLGDAQALDRHGGPHVLSCGESNLLFKRQCIN